ncbi:MAG: hypothetical protein WCR23_14195, partial [Planctomycetota bacterium]
MSLHPLQCISRARLDARHRLGGHGKHGKHGKPDKRFDFSQKSTYFRREKIDTTDSIVASGASRLSRSLGRIAPEIAREWSESLQVGLRVGRIAPVDGPLGFSWWAMEIACCRQATGRLAMPN